jgi:hypothetical protein
VVNAVVRGWSFLILAFSLLFEYAIIGLIIKAPERVQEEQQIQVKKRMNELTNPVKNSFNPIIRCHSIYQSFLKAEDP